MYSERDTEESLTVISGMAAEMWTEMTVVSLKEAFR